MKKLIPLTGYIQAVLELEPCSDADRPRGSKTENNTQTCSKRLRLSESSEDNFLPHLKAKEGTKMQLTEFPERNYPEGCTPSEITKHSLDSSFVLDLMLTKYSE